MEAWESTETSGVRSGFESRWVRTLRGIVAHTRAGEVVYRRDLRWGDRIVVSTRNSVYRLRALGDGTFFVSGGWFEKNDGENVVTINGCTYGGSAIRSDVVAGPGLFLEFGNRVLTTRIQNVRVTREEVQVA